MRKMHRAQTASRQQDLAPGGFGEDRCYFIFRELWSTGNYFRGSGEQAHSSGDLANTAKK